MFNSHFENLLHVFRISEGILRLQKSKQKSAEISWFWRKNRTGEENSVKILVFSTLLTSEVVKWPSEVLKTFSKFPKCKWNIHLKFSKSISIKKFDFEVNLKKMKSFFFLKKKIFFSSFFFEKRKKIWNFIIFEKSLSVSQEVTIGHTATKIFLVKPHSLNYIQQKDLGQ